MAICTLSGTLLDPTATAISTATVKFNVTTPVLDAGNNLIMPKEVSTTTNASGAFSLALDQGISGILTIEYPPNSTDGTRRQTYSLIIPSATTATLASLITEL